MHILVECCRKAIVAGTALPLALFLIWDAVILGAIPGLAGSGTITDPLEQLRSSNGIVGVRICQVFSFQKSWVVWSLVKTKSISTLNMLDMYII